MRSHPLEPDRFDMEAMAGAAARQVAEFIEGLPAAPAVNLALAERRSDRVGREPGDGPGASLISWPPRRLHRQDLRGG